MRYFKTTSTVHLACALALSACTVAGTAWAQTAPKPAPKPAAKPAAKAAAAAVVLTPVQMGIAQIVTTGRIACADGQSVTITPDAKVAGAFDVQFGKARYDVVPMPTKTGAVRLEDAKSGIVFMQLANKSMLFNEKQGKRLADDCISPAQKSVADAMLANPTAGVLEAPAK